MLQENIHKMIQQVSSVTEQMNTLFTDCEAEKKARRNALVNFEEQLELKTNKAEFSSLINNFGGSQVATLTDMRSEYNMKFIDLQQHL